jgi:chemotaxis protein methyltransferase CheR
MTTQQIEMSDRVFKQLCAIVYDILGIRIRPGKEALVSSRIGKRMRSLGIETHESYLGFLTRKGNEAEVTEFVNAITTNTTSFFREADHFEFLGDAVKQWVAEGRKRIRIWCAAASTGEEPYTIAMTLLEALSGNFDAKILATDVSTDVLSQCIAGSYADKSVEKIPKHLLLKYFERHGDLDSKRYVASQELKRAITFRQLNLLATPYPMKGPLDLIFLRNVMIYFDEAVRMKVVTEAVRLLRPGGYLLLGHTESLNGSVRGLEVFGPSVHIKR